MTELRATRRAFALAETADRSETQACARALGFSAAWLHSLVEQGA